MTTQVEFLLMLCESEKAQNDDWAAQVRQEGVARARRVTELMAMLDKAREILEQEQRRFNAYLPKPQEPMPRVVQQGPKT
jgi:hypothetical protein